MIRIFLNFFFIEEYHFKSTLFVIDIFYNINSQITLFSKWCPIFDTSQLSNFNNFLWVCWSSGKNLPNFVPHVWKFHNPYYHNEQAELFFHLPRSLWPAHLLGSFIRLNSTYKYVINCDFLLSFNRLVWHHIHSSRSVSRRYFPVQNSNTWKLSWRRLPPPSIRASSLPSLSGHRNLWAGC